MHLVDCRDIHLRYLINLIVFRQPEIMEILTIQPCIRSSQEDETASSILCCHGLLKLPTWSLKSYRQKIRRRSSKIIPIIGEGREDSSSLSEQCEQLSSVPSSNNGQRKHCWEEEDNTCSNAESGKRSKKIIISEKCRQLSQNVSAAIGHISKRSKPKDINTPGPAASGSIEAEKDCDETSRACSLLLRVMTTSHALFNDIMSILSLWKVVCKKPFSMPKDCKLTQTEFVDKLTRPIRRRIKNIVQELRKQTNIVDEMMRKADESRSGQSFKTNFATTNDYFKEFREVASQCLISKVLADFARAVSAIQMLINKCSSLSDRLSALGPNIPSPVNHSCVQTSIDGMAVKECSMEQRLLKLIKELAGYRKATLFISDEVKILDRKLEKQAKRDRQKVLRKELGRKKCPRSNRVVAQLHMSKVPMREVVNVMPCIEEE